MTDRQIDKAVEHYRAMLRKHRDEIGSAADIQRMLGQDDYVGEQVGVIRARVAALTGMTLRRVKVNRTRTPQEMLDALGRRQYTDRAVVDAMSRGEGEEVDMYFFTPHKSAYDRNGRISDDNLAKQYELRGLVPDPYAQDAVNEADPAFADEHPNGTHWKDADGNWCFATFDQWDGGRCVCVRRDGDGWRDDWCFGGRRK